MRSRLSPRRRFVLAMSVEALRGFRDAFLPHLHAVRGHSGQARVAEFVYRLLEGSTLARGDADIDLDPPPGRRRTVQSARRADRVGAVLDALEYIQGAITREINAVTDNPLIFLDEDGPLHLPRLDQGGVRQQFSRRASGLRDGLHEDRHGKTWRQSPSGGRSCCSMAA